jgi:SAM-dependent methyltransferase
MRRSMFRPLRLAELDNSIALLRRYQQGVRLLEIGAGTGWQAQALSEVGFDVEAVDLPAESAISNHAHAREWPILDYDGRHLPFADCSFDVVYSSNVLEHVVDLDTLMAEMRRVLRPDGVALHVLPNCVWRLLSILSFYPAVVVDAVGWLKRTGASKPTSGASPQNKSLIRNLFRRIIPHAHGSAGTPLTELARFSKRSWDRYFTSHRWEVLHHGNNGILASGDYLLDAALPMSLRRKIGEAVGGIAHVYLLRPEAR